MSRKKKVAAILLIVLIVSFLFVLYQSRFALHEQGKAGGFAVESVSLVNLIASPEKYQGKWVQVAGVCALEFEGNALYLSRSDLKHLCTKNAVWASYDTLGVEFFSLPSIVKFHRRNVLVEGYFDSYSQGHLGLFSGAITNVTRIITR